MAAVSKTTYDFETDRLSYHSNDSQEILLNELADEYSKYINVNFGQQEKALEDAVEGMLLRLDEFVTLIDMVRSDNSQCLSRTLPAIYRKFDRLNEMKEKIDKLEAFVKIVDKNLNEMEEKVVLAEQELRRESSIEKVLKPFFKKETTIRHSGSKTKLVYENPEILNVSNYFHSPESVTNDEPLGEFPDLSDEACALNVNIS